MTIQQLFNEMGLSLHAVNQLFLEIKAYNKQHPQNAVPAINVTEDIDGLTISQTPFIGRALAKASGQKFLDKEEKFPLELDENASLFATQEMDKYFRKNVNKLGEYVPTSLTPPPQN